MTSFPGERATISGYSEIPAAAAGVALQDLDFTSTGLPITVRLYGDDSLFEGNDITDNHMSGAGSCIGVGGSQDRPHGVVIRRNKIHDCGSNHDNLNHGIYAVNFSGLTITDNLFWMNGGYNIQLYPNGERAEVSHNVIDGSREYSTRGAIVIDGETAVDDIVEQNIIVDVPATTAGVNQRTGSGHIARSNCFYDNAGGNVSGPSITQIDNLTADPDFADRAAHDYRLAADSPCLAKVGHDTAALLAAGSGAPAPAPPTTPASPTPPTTPTPPTPPTTPVSDTRPEVRGRGTMRPRSPLTSPAGGATTTPPPVVTAALAADDRGVKLVLFLVDGKLVAGDAVASYGATWSVPRGTTGKHVVTALAYDASGLTATSSATVRAAIVSAAAYRRAQLCRRYSQASTAAHVTHSARARRSAARARRSCRRVARAARR